MAMRRLSRTITLMTENEPNMRSPKNRVNSLIPVNSKLSRSISPKIAQNNVCTVSHRLWRRCAIKIKKVRREKDRRKRFRNADELYFNLIKSI